MDRPSFGYHGLIPHGFLALIIISSCFAEKRLFNPVEELSCRCRWPFQHMFSYERIYKKDDYEKDKKRGKAALCCRSYGATVLGLVRSHYLQKALDDLVFYILATFRQQSGEVHPAACDLFMSATCAESA
jgi:hypothetical protein